MRGRLYFMATLLKRLGKAVLRLAVGVFGARITDQRTGRCAGKALVLPWRGRLHVIGLEEARLRPHFLPQERLTYWRQELGFSSHPEPDFPHEPASHSDPDASDSR